MKLVNALSGLVVAVYAGVAPAQSADPVVTDPIVVTAARSARSADETLASVTVITREQIERRQSQDLVDLLRTQAGIDPMRSGGPGGNVSLFLRGTNSNHVLVLIDGVRVASATSGTFDWRTVPMAQVERVEIVRGPRASLYGSDAIGGVIQIFTRRPQDPEIALGAGSRDTRRADVAWGGGGTSRFFIAGTHFETRGFSAQNIRGFSFDPDDDGVRHRGVSAGFEARLGEDTRFELIGRQNRVDAEFDVGEQDIENGSINARLSHALSPRWAQTLSAGILRDELASRTTSTSRIRTQRRSADWQNDFTLGAHALLTAGLAYVDESGVNTTTTSGTTLFDRDQDSRAAFAAWHSRSGGQDVQLAGRYDDYSNFGGHGTWSAAYGWTMTPASRGFVSYGTAFRAPSLNDLYHPGSGGLFAGNPNLEPERSRTAEIGIRQRAHGTSMAVSVFSTRVDDLIAFEGTNFQAINIAKASMRGIELEHELSAGAWQATSNVTLQRARNEVADTRLLRRPDRKFSTLLERHFDRASLGVEAVLSSGVPDFGGELPGYGVANLAARYRLQRSLSFEARVENLFDKQYQVINGFNTPDRALFLALRYRAQP